MRAYEPSIPRSLLLINDPPVQGKAVPIPLTHPNHPNASRSSPPKILCLYLIVNSLSTPSPTHPPSNPKTPPPLLDLISLPLHSSTSSHISFINLALTSCTYCLLPSHSGRDRTSRQRVYTKWIVRA
jgi:hypothetical protein